MNFNSHVKLEGLHAPFSASKSHWLRYDEEKLIATYSNLKAKEMGTRLHAWAKETIDLGIKQQRSSRTLPAYINDAIGYKMSTEVVLYYSDRFFGTADAISFRYEKNEEGRKIGVLRIHDLKTGNKPVSMEQLEVYSALFCLEYKIDPKSIYIELRVYQNNEVMVHTPEPEEIKEIMDIIVSFDKILERVDKREV